MNEILFFLQFYILDLLNFYFLRSDSNKVSIPLVIKDMLSAKEILEHREKVTSELPSFGIKDFQPDGSSKQSYQIQHSVSEIKNIISHKTIKLVNSLSQAVWHQDLHLAEVTHQTGSYWAYMGHMVGEKLYIYPEEALYLLETGVIQITYNGVPLSIQRAYFVFLGEQFNITVEKYRVYSLLHSYGFKVLRHSPKNSITNYEKKLQIHKLGIKLENYSIVALEEKIKQETHKPIKSNKKLKIIEKEKLPLQNKTVSTSLEILGGIERSQSFSNCSLKANLKFDFDIYSESSDKISFKKSCLQIPNFRVVIHRGEDPAPNFDELFKLSNEYRDEIPVIHAVVFFDYVAFYRIDPVILPNVDS